MNTDKLLVALERVAELLTLRAVPQAVRLVLKDARTDLQAVIANASPRDPLSTLDHVWAGLANARDTLNTDKRTACAAHACLLAQFLVDDVIREAEQRKAA